MIFNIDAAEDIKEIKLSVDGWLPLIINYGLFKISEKIYLLWNVVGSEHTFGVSLQLVMQQHGEKYDEHFKLTLKKFKEDLLEWAKEGLPEDWMKNYYKQFSDLLI